MTTTAADPRILLGEALDQTDTVLAAVPPDTMDRPTPCPEFDLGTLSRHVLAVLWRIRHVADGGNAADLPAIATGDFSAGELLSAYRVARSELEDAWADDAVLDRMLVSDALGALSRDHRAVIVAVHYLGRSVREIAETEGIAEGTVKSRLHYGMRALRLALQERGVTR